MSTMHNDVFEALDLIDAAMFSGDAFMHEEGRVLLREYLERWNKWDKESSYFKKDGTMLSADGSRSIFDDVDE